MFQDGFDASLMTLEGIFSKKGQDLYKVLYMSFDKFLLAVESRDLSQADKNII